MNIVDNKLCILDGLSIQHEIIEYDSRVYNARSNVVSHIRFSFAEPRNNSEKNMVTKHVSKPKEWDILWTLENIFQQFIHIKNSIKKRREKNKIDYCVCLIFHNILMQLVSFHIGIMEWNDNHDSDEYDVQTQIVEKQTSKYKKERRKAKKQCFHIKYEVIWIRKVQYNISFPWYVHHKFENAK